VSDCPSVHAPHIQRAGSLAGVRLPAPRRRPRNDIARDHCAADGLPAVVLARNIAEMIDLALPDHRRAVYPPNDHEPHVVRGGRR
jgi:hypothetical protein